MYKLHLSFAVISDVYMSSIRNKTTLTLKRLGHFFQDVILFSNVVQQKCNIFIWKCSNKLIV